MKKVLFLIFSLLLAIACQSYQKTVLILPNGFEIQARIADTPQKTEKGLMFVKKLAENEGMLFVFPQTDRHLFWMKNTWIDLDIIYLSEQGHITQLFERVPRTYSYTPDHQIPVVAGEGKYVLEVPAGTAFKQNLKIGDFVRFSSAL